MVQKSNPEANLVIEGWKRNEELLMELSKGGFGLVRIPVQRWGRMLTLRNEYFR